MGEPVKIVDLATDLVRLSGLSPEDIPVVFTGIRAGEKLTEALWLADQHERAGRPRHGERCRAERQGNARPVGRREQQPEKRLTGMMFLPTAVLICGA